MLQADLADPYGNGLPLIYTSAGRRAAAAAGIRLGVLSTTFATVPSCD